MREFRFLNFVRRLGWRDTWRAGEDDGGRVVGDGERLSGGEGGEGGAGMAEGAAVVRVSGGQVVASQDGIFD